MKPSIDIKPITYMKTNSADLIKEVNGRKSPIIITQNGEAKAVLMSVDTYEKQQQTLLMIKLLSQGDKAIREGRVISQEKFFKKMDMKLNKIDE